MSDASTTVLPDGSAFSIGSLPLPEDHWLYAEKEGSSRAPAPVVSNDIRPEVLQAARWAIRAATMNGKISDFDPDALAMNVAYALCGPAA